MDKSLKHLSRLDLLELMVKVSEENDALASENAQLKQALASKPAVSRATKVGSIAELALQANGFFEAAQRSADDYLREIKQMRDQLAARTAAGQQPAQASAQGAGNLSTRDANNQAYAIVNGANAQAESIIAEARKKAETMLADASRQSRSIISRANHQADAVIQAARADAEGQAARRAAQAQQARQSQQSQQAARHVAQQSQPRVQSQSNAPRQVVSNTGTILRGRHIRMAEGE